MFGYFGSKTLKDHLSATRKIRIHGVNFEIRKIDPMDYVDGSKVLLQVYDTYKSGKGAPVDEASAKKMRQHYIDVFMSGVVRPALSRKESGDTVFVEEIFRDQEMAHELYLAIMEYSYGKKKLSRGR